MGRIEVDQPRYELKALIDSEKPSKPKRGGRASNIPRSTCRISKATSRPEPKRRLHARRDRSGNPEDIREARIRLPLVTMHECMEPRVIAGSPPPALSPLTPVSQVSVVRNCSCDFAQANVQAALLASGDGNNGGARQSRSARKCLAHRGDHLDQRDGGDRARGSSRGQAEQRQSDLIIRSILEQSRLGNS